MRFWLIDVGNTFTKIAEVAEVNQRDKARKGGIGKVERIPTSVFGVSAMERVVRRKAGDVCVFCSVVPWARECIEQFFGNVSELNWKEDIGIGFDYPRPETLGADRLANAIACKVFYRVPAIIVSVGTAATFDILDAEGNFCGGAIAPGIELLADALYERTALLKRVSPVEDCRVVGKSTEEAIQAGVTIGFRGLVREIVNSIIEEKFSGVRPFVLGGGGGIRYVSRGMGIFDAIEQELVLHGLYAYARRRFGSLLD